MWQLYTNDSGTYLINKIPPRVSLVDGEGQISEINYRAQDFPYQHTSSQFYMYLDTLFISNQFGGYTYSKFYNDHVVNYDPIDRSIKHCVDADLLFDARHIYSICESQPTIRVFDRNSHKLKFIYDYSREELPKKNLQIEADDRLRTNTSAQYMYVNSSCIYKDYLFLLVYDHRRNGINDVVMVFKAQNDNIQFLKYGILPSLQSFSAICVDEEYLYTFNRDKSAVQKFAYKTALKE